MPRLPVAALLALLVAPAFAGCALWGGDDGDAPPTATGPVATPSPDVVRVTFGGRVVDALSREGVDDARVVLDLADTLPCQQESIIWNQWRIPVDEAGRFGPFVQPAPNSPTYRFFVHVDAPGYTRETRFVGPEMAAQAANMTFVLHPRVAVEGRAPPGTVVALTAPEFPRFAVADANGTFRFEDARTDPAQLVVASSVPHRETLTPPAVVNATANGTGWQLQGVVKRDDGRPIPARVVAWNGTQLWSAALTDEVGRFLLPLPAQPVELRIAALTEDDHYGGVLVREVRGPPAAVETVLVRALC